MTDDEFSNSLQIDSRDRKEQARVDYTIASRHFKITYLQEKVIKISELLMAKHYILKIKDLLNACLSMLNIKDENIILPAIEDLIEKRILVLGKGIALDTILENENRKCIFDLITAVPGLNKLKISDFLGLNYATTTWHLDVLERFKIIRPKQMENQEVYFNSSLDGCYETFYFSLQKRHVNELLSKILENPGISPNSLFDLLNIPKSTFYRKIQDLNTHGIVNIEIDSNSLKKLYINDKYKSKLKKLNG